MVAEIILVSPAWQPDAAKQSAQYVARGLSAIGMKVREQISVCETVKQLQQTVAAALGRSHVVVTLGGLGKEAGYMSKNTIAAGLGLPLELNHEALAAMRSYCHRTGESYTLEDNALAQLPVGSVAFPGSYGKIPGCVVSSSKQHIIMLPENQAEIMPMFNKYVSPYLGGAATTTVTRTVRTYGLSEAGVQELLGSMLSSANPAVTVQREQNEVLIRVSAHADTNQAAAALCTPVLRTIVDKMGDAAYGLDVESLQSAVISKLNKKELDIAVAEAGLGGMLTRVLTETEGGQDVLRYSVAVDEDAAKTEKLGISAKLLKKRGGVSEYSAVAMADAARRKVHTGIGVAICAVTEENATKKIPPGLVYIAVCDAEYVYVKKLVIGDGDVSDDVIVDATLSRALNMVRLFVDYLPGRYSGAISLIEALDGKTVTDKDSYDNGFDADDPQGMADEKKMGKGNKVRKFIFALAMLVFLSSAGYIGYTMYGSYQNKLLAEELNNMFEFGDMDEGDVEIPEDYPDNYNVKFIKLWQVNPDVKAFIKIDGTSVQYPIVQSSDNDYYLRRDFYQQSNQHGVPFFDFRVDVERPSDNMLVYGHNMTDGQIFGELVKYKELEYYKEHPVIDLATVYDKMGEQGQYKIFSVFISNAYENQGHVYDYYNFIQAESNDQFANFIKQAKYRSIIDTGVDAEPGDELLTLSTCSYEFKDMRTVIVARRVRKNENPEVKTSSAMLNPNPLYPDIWYNKYGGSKPEGIDSYWTVGGNASAYIGYQGDTTAPAATPAVVDPAASVSVSQIAVHGSSAASRQETSSKAATETSSKAATEASSKAAAEASSKAAAEASSKAAAEASSKAAAEASSKAAAEASSKAAAEASSKAAAEASSKAAAEASSKAAAEALSKAAAEASSKAAAEASSKAAAEASSKAAADAAWMDTDEVDTTDTVTPSPMSLKTNSSGELTVLSGGSRVTKDALNVVASAVQNEVGSNFNTEALKAQAVASYTFIAQSNAAGNAPSVNLNTNVDSKVLNAVSQVIGEAVYYKNQLAFTPYHATSAGATTTSTAVWGGSPYPYLVSVDSSVDQKVKGYKTVTTMTSDKVSGLLSSRLGIDAEDDPNSWFEIQSYEDGDYIGKVSVCGYNKSPRSGAAITGRLLRESVFGLRSANFTIDYDAESDKFTFTTYGYGHGVGMSQNGANAYAAQGWDYVEILKHYYPGTTIK